MYKLLPIPHYRYIFSLFLVREIAYLSVDISYQLAAQ